MRAYHLSRIPTNWQTIELGGCPTGFAMSKKVEWGLWWGAGGERCRRAGREALDRAYRATCEPLDGTKRSGRVSDGGALRCPPKVIGATLNWCRGGRNRNHCNGGHVLPGFQQVLQSTKTAVTGPPNVGPGGRQPQARRFRCHIRTQVGVIFLKCSPTEMDRSPHPPVVEKAWRT